MPISGPRAWFPPPGLGGEIVTQNGPARKSGMKGCWARSGYYVTRMPRASKLVGLVKPWALRRSTWSRLMVPSILPLEARSLWCQAWKGSDPAPPTDPPPSMSVVAGQAAFRYSLMSPSQPTVWRLGGAGMAGLERRWSLGRRARRWGVGLAIGSLRPPGRECRRCPRS